MTIDALEDDAESSFVFDDFSRIGGRETGRTNCASDFELEDGL